MSDTNNIPDPTLLRSLAQNDYNIDGHLLPDGQMLYDVAQRIEQTEALLVKQTQKAVEAAFDLRAAQREIEVLKKKNQNQAMMILSKLDEDNGL